MGGKWTTRFMLMGVKVWGKKLICTLAVLILLWLKCLAEGGSWNRWWPGCDVSVMISSLRLSSSSGHVQIQLDGPLYTDSLVCWLQFVKVMLCGWAAPDCDGSSDDDTLYDGSVKQQNQLGQLNQRQLGLFFFLAGAGNTVYPLLVVS